VERRGLFLLAHGKRRSVALLFGYEQVRQDTLKQVEDRISAPRIALVRPRLDIAPISVEGHVTSNISCKRPIDSPTS
jgi:hypothetical protein